MCQKLAMEEDYEKPSTHKIKRTLFAIINEKPRKVLMLFHETYCQWSSPMPAMVMILSMYLKRK